jgi:hypothetical protein
VTCVLIKQLARIYAMHTAFLWLIAWQVKAQQQAMHVTQSKGRKNVLVDAYCHNQNTLLIHRRDFSYHCNQQTQ